MKNTFERLKRNSNTKSYVFLSQISYLPLHFICKKESITQSQHWSEGKKILNIFFPFKIACYTTISEKWEDFIWKKCCLPALPYLALPCPTHNEIWNLLSECLRLCIWIRFVCGAKKILSVSSDKQFWWFK